MLFITTLAALGLIAVASAKVVVKPSPNVTVYHKDLLQFNLTDLFSFGANVTCDFFPAVSPGTPPLSTSWRPRTSHRTTLQMSQKSSSL